MKLLKLLKGLIDPYDNYTPSPTLPTFDFGRPSNGIIVKSIQTAKPVTVLPENVTEKITSVGVKYEKKTETETGVEFEVWGEKKTLLTESEMNEVLQKFPKIDKTAIVITKRAWAKNMTVPQTIAELKKQNLGYSQTYIKVMRSIFNKMG
jgi:hypothetical protein